MELEQLLRLKEEEDKGNNGFLKNMANGAINGVINAGGRFANAMSGGALKANTNSNKNWFANDGQPNEQQGQSAKSNGQAQGGNEGGANFSNDELKQLQNLMFGLTKAQQEQEKANKEDEEWNAKDEAEKAQKKADKELKELNAATRQEAKNKQAAEKQEAKNKQAAEKQAVEDKKAAGKSNGKTKTPNATPEPGATVTQAGSETTSTNSGKANNTVTQNVAVSDQNDKTPTGEETTSANPPQNTQAGETNNTVTQNVAVEGEGAAVTKETPSTTPASTSDPNTTQKTQAVESNPQADNLTRYNPNDQTWHAESIPPQTIETLSKNLKYTNPGVQTNTEIKKQVISLHLTKQNINSFAQQKPEIYNALQQKGFLPDFTKTLPSKLKNSKNRSLFDRYFKLNEGFQRKMPTLIQMIQTTSQNASKFRIDDFRSAINNARSNPESEDGKLYKLIGKQIEKTLKQAENIVKKSAVGKAGGIPAAAQPKKKQKQNQQATNNQQPNTTQSADSANTSTTSQQNPPQTATNPQNAPVDNTQQTQPAGDRQALSAIENELSTLLGSNQNITKDDLKNAINDSITKSKSKIAPFKESSVQDFLKQRKYI